jgi:hypothetical protein
MMTIPREPPTAYDRQCAHDALTMLETIFGLRFIDKRDRAMEAMTLCFAAARIKGEETHMERDDIRVARIELPITAAEIEAAQR